MNELFKLPELSPNANKYSRGKLFVMAGSERYPGAAVLAAHAAQRMGAGYTEVVTTRSAIMPLLCTSPSLVVVERPRFDEINLYSTGDDKKPKAVCIGPGFSGDAEESRLVKHVLKIAECPILVDGGGLSILVAKRALEYLALRAQNGFATAITPHQGEAARMADDLGVVYSEDSEGAKLLAQALNAVVVLKGPDTFISDGREVVAMTEGTAALAKAGTGDVLAGMISSLLAQGLDAMSAAYTGAFLHAQAGVCAAGRLTGISVTAEDVIDSIPEAIKQHIPTS